MSIRLDRSKHHILILFSKSIFILLCLAAIALSKTLDYYVDIESSQMNNAASETNDGDDKNDSDTESDSRDRNLYDKVGQPSRRRAGLNGNNQDNEEDSSLVASNIKTIVTICSK